MVKEKFERVVLAFNESGYSHHETQIANFCEAANEAVNELHEEFGLPLNDAEVEAMFLNRASNPGGLIEKHFSQQKSRTLREESIKDLREFIGDKLANFRHVDDTICKAVYVKRGKLLPDPAKLQTVKKQYEKALESPRAVELFNKHKELFEKYCEFVEVVQGSPTVLRLWYEDLNSGSLRMAELNYNNL